MIKKEKVPDGRPTIAEWPVRIWARNEIPHQFEEQVGLWLKEDFSEYDFVFAPVRRTNPKSFSYLFAYGNDKILYLKESRQKSENENSGEEAVKRTEIYRKQITMAATERELLNAKIILNYQDGEEQKTLEFPYVPSAYYLYDPFLNWVLGLGKDFMPALTERENPRPQKLYHESLVMFNYSLGAYRLGDSFQEYSYKSKQHRRKWMPWKKTLEEWLEISMERGTFELHSFGYLTECTYRIRKDEKPKRL